MYDPQAQTPADAPAPEYTDDAWATVLRENVKGALVDYRHLSTHAEPLDNYLELVARTGPRRAPDQFRAPRADLAYYINAYNACVLSAVLRAGIPESMYDIGLPPLETGNRFLIDGAPRSLAQIHDLARNAAGADARVEFALCGAALGMPPLASQPFRAFDVVERLRDLAQEAMNSPRMVRVDHENGRILVGLPIWSNLEAFEQTYRRETASESGTVLNCLMHMAHGARREYLARATGYAVRILPFDRALNAWNPQPAG